MSTPVDRQQTLHQVELPTHKDFENRFNANLKNIRFRNEQPRKIPVPQQRPPAPPGPKPVPRIGNAAPRQVPRIGNPGGKPGAPNALAAQVGGGRRRVGANKNNDAPVMVRGISNVQNAKAKRQELEKSIAADFGQAALNHAKKLEAQRSNKGQGAQSDFAKNRRLFIDAQKYSQAGKAATGLTVDDIGVSIGKDIYRPGDVLGSEKKYIVLSEKASGRDPGVFAVKNPFRHPNTGELNAKFLKEALNGKHGDEKKNMAKQIVTCYFRELQHQSSRRADKQPNDEANNSLRRNLAKAIDEAEAPTHEAAALKYFSNLRSGKIKGQFLRRAANFEKTQNAPNFELSPKRMLESAQGRHGKEKQKNAHEVMTDYFGKLTHGSENAKKGDKKFDQKQAIDLAIRQVTERALEKNFKPTAKDFMAQYFNNLKTRSERNDFLIQASLHRLGKTDPEIQKKYMIKGDYKEKDRSKFLSGVNWMMKAAGVKKRASSVRISTPLARTKKSAWITAQGYRVVAGDTRKGANAGVVKEALATDIMRELSKESDSDSPTYITQDFTIAKGKWDNGTTKLLANIKLIDRDQAVKAYNDPTIDPNAGFQDFEGKIVDGRLVNQVRSNPNGPYQALQTDVHLDKETGKPDAKPSAEFFSSRQDHRKYKRPAMPIYKEGSNVRGLGRAKAKMLVLRDRDALGGRGANKGQVGNYMAAIDPGKAFETRDHQINDDFTFEQPSKKYHSRLKNFDIFDQAPLSEKMKGIKDIQDLHDSGKDEQIFDNYKDKWTVPDDKACDFGEDVSVWKENYTTAKNGILDTFKDRLSVYKMGLSPKQVDNTFDTIDNLEKLTSESDWRSENGLVELTRPRIKKDSNGNFQRVKWNVKRADDGRLMFTAKMKTKNQMNDVAARMKGVHKLVKQNQNQVGNTTTVFKDPAENTVGFLIEPQNLAELTKHFNNDYVKEQVKQRDLAQQN